MVSVFAAVALLLFAGRAHAAGFTLTYSGPTVTGTIFLNATPNGDGTFTVTSASGSQTFNGVAQTVTGVVPLIDGSLSRFYIGEYHYFGYDNLLMPGSFPVFDTVGGLLLTFSGVPEPVVIYYDGTGRYGDGIGYQEGFYVGSDGNDLLDSAFTEYPITSLTLQAQSVALLDPVLTLFLPTTSTITSDLSTLASSGRDVSAIAADGVAQLLVRVTGLGQNDQINVSILDENGKPAPTDGEDGTLSNLIEGTQVGPTSASPVPQGVNGQYEAFVLYQSPIDFARVLPGDNAIASRQLTIQVTDSNNNVLASTPFQLLRPPVFFVHGLWSGPSTWNEFDQFLKNSISGINTYRADYEKNNGNSVALNTPNVIIQAYTALNAFRATNNAAAVQLDFIVHSMGGLISDTMPTLALFRIPANYGQGIIHKLITVDTPYQGSPFAAGLNQSGSSCKFLLGTLGAKVGGAVRDLVPGGAFGQTFNPAPPGYSKHAIASYVTPAESQVAEYIVNTLILVGNASFITAPLADVCFSVFVTPTDFSPPTFTFTDFFFTPGDPYGGANDLIVSEKSQLGPYVPDLTADTTSGLAHSKIPIPFLNISIPGALDSGEGSPMSNPGNALNLLNSPTKSSLFVQ